jgi:uncharacterized protein (DUF1330 family)
MADEGPIYVLAQLRIHDRARYLSYVRRFAGVLARHEGVLLAADEAPLVVEGSWDRDKVVLLRFESERGYEAWAHSPEYQEILQDRVGSAQATVLLVATRRSAPATHGCGAKIPRCGRASTLRSATPAPSST